MILLINPGHDGSHQHASHRSIHRDPPPMSCLYVGTHYAREGHDVQILDTHVDNAWKGIIRQAKDLEWIGISVIIGQNLANAREITEWCRKYKPGVPIKWGGVFCSVFPEEVKAEYGPDEVITGRFDENIIPDYTLLGESFNKQQIPYYHMVFTSSGCPFSCSFCYNQCLNDGTKYNLKSAEMVMAELEAMHEITNTKVFTFGDDNFLINKQRALLILDYMRKRGWYAEEVIGHFGNLDEELIEAMSGVVQTFIGSVETASPKLQKLLNKNLDVGAVPGKLESLNRHGIAANVAFIVGLPTEDDSDLAMNTAFMEGVKKAAPWTRAQAYLFYPLPKTKLTAFTADHYGVNLDFTMSDYEKANFWFDEKMDGNEFRPWIPDDRYQALYEWGTDFKTKFHYPNGHGPYVLDRVLSNEKIDLSRDLWR